VLSGIFLTLHDQSGELSAHRWIGSVIRVKGDERICMVWLL
jgi:hypothetical protein